MENNLFQYATSELSQDAFICWCLNWFNDNRKPKLQEMAVSLVKRMAGDILVESVDIVRQYSKSMKRKDGKKDTIKIDVFAIINQEIGLIIEDKTFSYEHDHQIFRYIDGIRQILAEDGSGQLCIEEKAYKLDPEKLRTVFWKTGFFFDYDQVVTADVKIDGLETFKLLSPFRGESEILDDYLDNLNKSIIWYEEHRDYTIPHTLDSGMKCYDWDCSLARWQYPQYCLMRSFFPAEMWSKKPDSKSELYQVYHGSSFGRPWSEMDVFVGHYPGTDHQFSLFWRIDTDKNGPYLSLRFYDQNFGKTISESDKERHSRKYEEYLKALKEVLKNALKVDNSSLVSWEQVYPGYRGNYKEADIFHLQLSKYLADWKAQGYSLIETIRQINDCFLRKIASPNQQ